MSNLRILSLGWGVQSFTLAVMAALGEIESVDYAIHADTTHESLLTYQFAEKWTPWLNERGVKIETMKAQNANVINGRGDVLIPAFVDAENMRGIIRRECTWAWKVTPMRQWMSADLERRELKKSPGAIQQLIGISLDEFQRARQSDVKYIENVYPLIDKRMTRADCVRWLESHGLEVPTKSACVFCPFHSTADWRSTKNTPTDWEKAIETDAAIRHGSCKPGALLFIHPSRKPLDEVDFRTAEEKGQLSLWDNECSGICGV